MKKQRVLISGGSGFLGSSLCFELLKNGYDMTVLTRNTKKAYLKLGSKIHYITSIKSIPTTVSFDIIINLSGHPINCGRWTDKIKESIYDSRINTTLSIVDFIAKARIKPSLLINASAVGYYGHSNSKKFIETDKSTEDTFITDLCLKWEATAKLASEYGVRVVSIRNGVILGNDGGMLPESIKPFKRYLGGVLGNGKQWFSWIHLQDAVSAILHIINNKDLTGAINLTSPYPLTNLEYTQILGKVLQKPTFFSLPSWFLRIIFGEVANELLLQGQIVIPAKLLESEYKFQYPTAESALMNLLC